MKRRETFRLIPLTLAGIGSIVKKTSAFEDYRRIIPKDSNMPFAMKYAENIIEMLQWVRSNQSEKILESAYAIARATLKGKTCWSIWDQGHSNRADIFPGRNGEPEIFTAGYDPKKAKDGDLFLAGFPFSEEVYDDLDRKDIFVIGGACPWSADIREGIEHIRKDILRLRIRKHADIWIETTTNAIGAQVKIPGMPLPLGPESGPLYLTIMWMMLADACRILSLEGKPVKVKGDEPELSKDRTRWEKLADPLMDDFFDEIIRELELIGAELGSVRQIATMAVDTILNGGKVYCYSQYRESLASESSGRRGGLMLAFRNGLYDGKIEGTEKDCVLMGVYKPDDEVDLKNLDEFKRRGMRVASIGPLTRDFKIPEGRTVHKETEAHIGNMCDTYGMFAIPGFKKKVCPTSGILNIAMLWTITLEIVEQIIRRTNGNVPAIAANGALTWCGRYEDILSSLVKDRGY